MRKEIWFTLNRGLPKSAPTAAMGWRAYWQAMDGTSIYSDAGVTPATNGQGCYRMTESLGIISGSYFEQATAGQRPTYTTGGAGGKSYLAFDGTDDYMETLAISNFFANNAKTLIVACTVQAGWANNDYILGGTGSRLQFVIQTGNLIFFQHYDGTMDSTGTISFSDGTPLVISAKHDSGNIYVRKNGGAWSSAVASENTPAMFELWRIASRGANYLPMHFYAHCVANVVVSDANIALVENYFMSQLGL